jgi:tRNA pseudouridine55 synthase
MKGFINLIKPEGMSSAYAVSRVKKKLKTTCGHMGTLDPMASGVLPVGIDKTSRMFDYLLDKTKTYVAEFEFGYTTDTLDITGEVVERTDKVPTEEQIEGVLSQFVGIIDQIPPKYSAKCIDGKRGYELARRGVEFELQAKKVEILSLLFIGMKLFFPRNASCEKNSLFLGNAQGAAFDSGNFFFAVLQGDFGFARDHVGNEGNVPCKDGKFSLGSSQREFKNFF